LRGTSGFCGSQWSISSTIYEQLLRQYFFAKKLQSQIVTREKLHKTLLNKKVEHKMLLKLTPGLKTLTKILSDR
jgi:hypothetical protein